LGWYWLATPITLVATQVPVVDKAAVIDTVSDPIAETEWFIPGNKLIVDQRTPSSLAGLAAPIKSAGLAATF
jgi:hypothetical protein